MPGQCDATPSPVGTSRGEVDNTVAAAEEPSQSEIVANYVHFSFPHERVVGDWLVGHKEC